MGVVDISYKHMLHEVTQKLSLPAPKYGLRVDTASQFTAYVDVAVQRGDTVVEMICSWGTSAYAAIVSEEDMAQNCINMLRNDLGFSVRDVNFEDFKFYKSMYTQLTEQYNVLAGKYNTLKWYYDFLKECYNKAMDEKDYSLAEGSELEQALDRVFGIVQHRNMVIDAAPEGVAQHPSTAGATEDPSTAAGTEDPSEDSSAGSE